jgi:hypothetical protein
MCIRDVNNYLAITDDKEVNREDWLILQKESPEKVFRRKDGKFYVASTKSKGYFEVDKPLHKNNSFKIIRKALYDYFIHDIEPAVFLERNQNVFDYCAYVKGKGGWGFKERDIIDNQLSEKSLQKTVRYYIKNKGVKLIKYHTDGREQQLEAGKWLQQVYNLHEPQPFESYDIDTNYYLQKINKEILGINPNAFSKQLTLNF